MACRSLGAAESSSGNRASAINVYNAFRRKKNLVPVEEATLSEFEGDNLEKAFVDFGYFAANTPIPTYADENLMPTNPNNKRCVVVTTLKKYVGQVKEYLRYKLRHHPDLPLPSGRQKPQDPAWWTGFLAGFEKEATRFQLKMAGNEEIEFGIQSTLPLYRRKFGKSSCTDYNEGGPWFVEEDGTSPPINDFVSVIDLQFVLSKLFKEASMSAGNHLEQNAILLTTYLACGRGGEVKFNDFTEWVYHPSLQGVDIGWTEVKTVSKYSMLMVSSVEDPLLDFFHALGCYFSLGKGLYRDTEALHNGLGNYLFPSLHGMDDKSVSSAITNVIRRCLPPRTPSSIKNQFSAKSLRQGAVNDLASHSDIGLFDTCARSGHSTGLSVDYYTDSSNVLRGMPGANVLAGNSSARQTVMNPRLEALGVVVRPFVWKLFEQLYVVAVPFFKPSGSLFCVLKICTASLIMWHNHVTRKYSPANAMSSFLCDAARRAGIQDPRYPRMSPESILSKWSDLICDDFKRRNQEVHNATDTLVSIARTLNQVSANLLDLKEEVANNKRVSDERDAQHQEHHSLYRSVLEKENAALKESLHHLQNKLAWIRTPTKVMSTPPGAKRGPVGMLLSTEGRSVRRRLDESSTTPVAATSTSPSAGGVVVETSYSDSCNTTINSGSCPVVVNNNNSNNSTTTVNAGTTGGNTTVNSALRFGNKAREISSSKNSQKQMHVDDLLEEMHQSGAFLNRTSKLHEVSDYPKTITDKYRVRYSLELCDFIMTKDERKRLAAPYNGHDMKSQKDFYRDITKRMMDKLIEFEGGDPVQEKRLKKRGAKKKSTYVGIGDRVKAYKQKIAAGRGATMAEAELCEYKDCPTDPKSGIPPPGNSLIGDFFQSKSVTPCVNQRPV